jgi:catechol 2,3-dioxygenase-like lactoylglutathione lyase family enzyme
LAHSLAAIAFLAPEYDPAIAWFRDALGFAVLEDRPLGGDKRWVVVGDPSGLGARIIIARAVGEKQLAAVGEQTGGRVGYFIETDDFVSDYQRLTHNGVEFLESPRRELYGVVAVFKDPWGGKWDLIQRAHAAPATPLHRQVTQWAVAIGGFALVVNTLGSEITPFLCGIAVG